MTVASKWALLLQLPPGKSFVAFKDALLLPSANVLTVSTIPAIVNVNTKDVRNALKDPLAFVSPMAEDGAVPSPDATRALAINSSAPLMVEASVVNSKGAANLPWVEVICVQHMVEDAVVRCPAAANPRNLPRNTVSSTAEAKSVLMRAVRRSLVVVPISVPRMEEACAVNWKDAIASLLERCSSVGHMVAVLLGAK